MALHMAFYFGYYIYVSFAHSHAQQAARKKVNK